MKITFTHNTLCRYRELNDSVCRRSDIPPRCKNCKAPCENKYQMLMTDHHTCMARKSAAEMAVRK